MNREQELRVTVLGLRPGQRNKSWVIRPRRILYFFVEAAGPYMQVAAESAYPFDEGQVFFKTTDGLIYRASKCRGLEMPWPRRRRAPRRLEGLPQNPAFHSGQH